MEDLKNNVIPLYFLGMNGLLLVLMGFDKLCAVMRKWRIPERTLLGIGLFGGGFGGGGSSGGGFGGGSFGGGGAGGSW